MNNRGVGKKDLFQYTPGNLGKSYQHFEMSLSNECKAAFSELRISNPNAYSKYGDLLGIETELKSFIESLDNENAKVSAFLAKYLVGFINDILMTMQQESAWITVRATAPNDFFKMPRWHYDGYFFKPHMGEQYRIVATFKGPNTLFQNVSDKETREAFEAVMYNRQASSDLLKNKVPDVAPVGHATVFVAGKKDIAAIHSEPHVNTHRFFLAVTPASHKQIKEHVDYLNSSKYLALIEQTKANLKI